MENPFSLYSTWPLVAIFSCIICTVLKNWITKYRSKDRQGQKFHQQLTEKLSSYKPEPLVNPKTKPLEVVENILPVETCIDLVRKDYLSLSVNALVRESSARCIRKYAVGACGPPSFFGNCDLHEQLQQYLVDLYETQRCYLYSYGALTTGSIIASYVTSKDLLACHRMTSPEITRIFKTLNAHIVYYENFPELNCAMNLRSSSKKYARKFLILEGIYETTGLICDLPEAIRVASKYQMLVIVDESYSFGVLGVNGKGILEHWAVCMEGNVDVIGGSLEYAWGAMGGYTVGSMRALEVQQLLSKSYVYSASLPAFAVGALLEAFRLKSDRPRILLGISLEFHAFLLEYPQLGCVSSPESPRKVLAVPEEWRQSVWDFCRDRYGVYLGRDSPYGLVVNLSYDLHKGDREKYRTLLKALKESALLIHT